MDLATILDICIDRMRAGESPAACLASYPEYANQLAPMLAAAGHLSALQRQQLPAAERIRAKAVLRAHLAEQPVRRARFDISLLWQGIWPKAFGTALAALVLVVLAVQTVAASQPGQVAYRLRVLAERVPVVFEPDPVLRAQRELVTAGHRLGELQGYLLATGQLDPAALDAMIGGDGAAARLAGSLSESSRSEVDATLNAHATALERLAAGSGDPGTAYTLNAAAQSLRNWTGPEQQGNPAPVPTATAITAEHPGPQSTAIASPTQIPAASPTVRPAARPDHAPSGTPAPSHRHRVRVPVDPTHWPVGSPQPGSTPAARPSMTPARVREMAPTATTMHAGQPAMTPAGPQATSVPPAPGPEPAAGGPQAGPAPEGPDTEATPEPGQGPGPGAGPEIENTPATGPQPDNTPVADPTSAGPGPGPSGPSSATPSGSGPGQGNGTPGGGV